jgi:hypothetical protein
MAIILKYFNITLTRTEFELHLSERKDAVVKEYEHGKHKPPKSHQFIFEIIYIVYFIRSKRELMLSLNPYLPALLHEVLRVSLISVGENSE